MEADSQDSSVAQSPSSVIIHDDIASSSSSDADYDTNKDNNNVMYDDQENVSEPERVEVPELPAYEAPPAPSSPTASTELSTANAPIESTSNDSENDIPDDLNGNDQDDEAEMSLDEKQNEVSQQISPTNSQTQLEEYIDDDSEGEDEDYLTKANQILETEAEEQRNAVVGKQGRRVYAYEAKIQPPPAPLLPPEELPDQGLYDPFNSSAPHTDTENPPQSQKYSAAFEPIDFSTVTDWSPIYIHPLQSSLSSPHPIISQSDYDMLFPKIDIIMGLNKELLSNLSERISVWDNRTKIADIFVRMASFFKMYTEYCSKYEGAVETYRRLIKESPAFVEFLKIPEAMSDVHGLDLLSFLIMPCQRIPRYLMLIQELNKWTWLDHPDKKDLEEAVSKWQQVATHVNESMAEAGRMNELLRIEEQFNHSLNLVVPFRKFLKQGLIHKITSRIIVSPTYFLFSDILVYGYPSSDGNKVKYKGTIPLNTSWIRDLEDNENIQNGFQLVAEHKTYTLYCDTLKEKRSWIDAIENAINKLVAVDPTLVTKRATEVKTTTRVGQQIWNLFTRDTSKLQPTDEEKMIVEHLDSMNKSLAHSMHDTRMLQPIRSSMENDSSWTVLKKSNDKQKSESKKEKEVSEKEDKKADRSKVPATMDTMALEPVVIPIEQVPEIISTSPTKTTEAKLPVSDNPFVESNPLSDFLAPPPNDWEAPVSLDSALDSARQSPTQARSTRNQSPPRAKRGILVESDKKYSPLLNTNMPSYDGNTNKSGTAEQAQGCSCSIL